MSKWIDEMNYVEDAEAIIKSLNERKALISTSKIRNILSMISSLYNRAIHSNEQDKLDREFLLDLKYYKMRCVYEAGRDGKVKSFMEQTKMLDYVDGIGNSKENFLLYYHYVEALVAYHRFYGGRTD